jgi:hypothetical protein
MTVEVGVVAIMTLIRWWWLKLFDDFMSDIIEKIFYIIL